MLNDVKAKSDEKGKAIRVRVWVKVGLRTTARVRDRWFGANIQAGCAAGIIGIEVNVMALQCATSHRTTPSA